MTRLGLQLGWRPREQRTPPSPPPSRANLLYRGWRPLQPRFPLPRVGRGRYPLRPKIEGRLLAGPLPRRPQRLPTPWSLGLSPARLRGPFWPRELGVTGGRRSAARRAQWRAPRTREEAPPRFFQRTSGTAVLWSSARAPAKPPRSASRQAHSRGRPGLGPLRPPAQPGPSAAGPTRSGIWGWERPRGRQQLVSPQGAAPPFPGTKAAARAKAPRGRAERGRGAGSGEPGPGSGTSPGSAPKLPTSPVRLRGGVGLVLQGEWRALGAGEGAATRRGTPEGNRETAGGPRAKRGQGGAREAEPGEGREVSELETYCSRRTRSRRRPARPPAAWRAAVQGCGRG